MKKKILDDYISKNNVKSIDKFAENWVLEREQSKLPHELNYSPKYVAKLIRDSLDDGSMKKTKNRGGGLKKVNNDVLKCLICTIFDFLAATDEEITKYLNKYGPCQGKKKNISVKTVSRILNENLIKTKVPYFSPKERNTFGAMVLRFVWAKVMQKMCKEQNNLFIFIDEAAVLLGKNKTRARGFYSVVPIVNKPLTSKKMSILAAIIPGFGMCYKWFEKSVKGKSYARFLREQEFATIPLN